MSIYVYACLVSAGMSEKNSAKEKLTAKALQYLRDHYMEPFSLDEIAGALSSISTTCPEYSANAPAGPSSGSTTNCAVRMRADCLRIRITASLS